MYNDAFTPFDDIQCEDGIDIDIDERNEALEDLANDPDFIDGCDHLSEDVEDLFDNEGGLTADAYAMLAEMDSAGAFNS